jgi:hypothetical protein
VKRTPFLFQERIEVVLEVFWCEPICLLLDEQRRESVFHLFESMNRLN